jgi:environmental stress-induced protein Ves
MPWKNGGGVTKELFKEEGRFRLSVARVAQDGPFSIFEGVHRHLLVLEGVGIFLNEKRLLPHQIINFSGEEKIFAKLIEGPITDFNVMVNQDFGEARVQFSTETSWKASTRTFIYDHGEKKIWEGRAGEEFLFDVPRQRIVVELISK